MPTSRCLRAFHPVSSIHRAIIYCLSFILLTTLCAPIAFAIPPAVPFVDIVAPISVTPGSTGVTLTVLGTGFTGLSVVRWNGTALVTTFVSAQKLTAAVPDVFVAAVGLGTITVVTGSGVVSNVTYVPVTPPEAGTSFPSSPSSSVSVGTFPQGIAAADFNNDGKIDLAVANNTDGTVSVLLGNGDGTFAPALVANAGVGANWIAVGDFNGDGKLDMAVANAGSTGAAGVTILLGVGDGTFTAGASLTTGNSPFEIATADFNADGRLDLAVSNAVDGTMSVFLGVGDGTFTAGSTPTVGTTPQVIVVGDFNEDGNLDLAVTNQGDNTVSLLLGVGNGTFGAQAIIPAGASGFPIGLIAADFNGDGHLDLAAVNASTVGVLLGNGAGAFTLHETASTGTLDLISGVTGDYNGDGRLDLIISDRTAGEAFLLPGVGDGTFGTAVMFTTAAGSYGVATGDFNGDGGLDLAITNGGADNVSIFLQQLPVTLSPSSLSFGNQNVGSASAPQTVMVTNSSGATLNISSIAFTGANSGDFARGDTCAATLANLGTCTITVTFSPTAAGSRVATLTVTNNAPKSPQTLAVSGTGVVSAPTIAKIFGAANIPLNGGTSLTLTITNPVANATALSGVAFSDSFPSGLVVSTPNALVNTCNGTATATAGAGSVSLTAGTIPINSSCTVTVNVTGVTAGAQANTTGAVSATESGTGAVSNTANLMVMTPPTIAKSFGAASISLAASTSLTFTITNPNAGAGLTGVAFADTMPSGLTVSTPNGLTGTCGAGTIAAAAGVTSLSLTGGTIPASGSCTFSVNVTAAASGSQVNTTGTVSATNGGTGTTATASLTVLGPDLTIVKSHVGDFKQGVNGSTYTIIVSNAGAIATTGVVAMTDTLPTGLTATAITGTGWTCTVGTAVCTRSDVLAGAAAYPSITVTVNVSGTAAASVTNAAVVSGGGDSSPLNNTATDVTIVDVTPPDFTLVASPTTATVVAGSPVTFTFTLTPLNNVPFTAPITLAVTGAPTNTSFVFEPASVTPGTGPTTATFVLKTSARDPYVAGKYGTQPGLGSTPLYGILVPLTGLALTGLSLRKRKDLRDRTSRALLIVTLACTGWGLYGCASGTLKFNQLGTPAGTYTLSITATSGSVAHSAPVTLTVQP